MRLSAYIFIVCALLFAVAPATSVEAASGPDRGVIRLRAGTAVPESPTVPENVEVGEARRGFDYAAFENRLEGLWFQRKTLHANGRTEDGRLQLERIRSFCAEEGVERLEDMAGALIAEAHREIEEGNYDNALNALHYAEGFDPLRPQIFLGRAAIHWDAERAYLSAAVDLFRGLRVALARSVQDLSLFHQLAFTAGVSLVIGIMLFAAIMIFRYQVPFRHEIVEAFGYRMEERWATLLGWIVLGLPLLTWFGAGWTAIYWIVITFRFMRRGERMTATVLLLACALSMPTYRVIVALYGTSADPAVRTTLAAADGEYDPDRIVKLRKLVEAHPDAPVYRFLLAGLYKNGRYFEEAFGEYRRILAGDPSLAAVHINTGNIFYATGQYEEAIRHYRAATELDGGSFLAYFNMHLAQSEAFRFGAAEQSLRRARELDASHVAKLLSGAGGWGDRPSVQDASLRLASVWEAALQGRRLLAVPGSESAAPTSGGAWPLQLLNPIAVISIVALLACFFSAFVAQRHTPARRCVRCGRPYCHLCKSGREAQEYCSQCVHMYVLGDGLAPGAKSRKLYEVERHERITLRVRRLVSALLPGAAWMLRGRTGRGLLLILLWVAALVAVAPRLFAVLLRLVGIEFRLDLAASGSVPAPYDLQPLALVALLLMPLLWGIGNFWRFKQAEF